MEIILYNSSMKSNLVFVLIAVIFTLILTIIIFSYNDIDLAFADVTVLEALDSKNNLVFRKVIGLIGKPVKKDLVDSIWDEVVTESEG